MALADGVSARVAYKAFASGTMTSNSQDQAPGATGAQILRRTTASLSLSKSTYQSAEIRSDKQIADFRHGARSVNGSISGEFSPSTYFELITAVHRDTATATFNADASDLTSVVSSSTGTFTFAGGNPVSLGFKVGDIIRFNNLATAANNSKNFLITAFGGTTNRTVSVYPAPVTDAVADSSFTVTRPGKSTIVPASGHVSRKFAFETYHSDLDIARLFTECRMTGYRLGLPAEGMSTIEMMLMGRDMVVHSGSNAPYFTSPTDATSTGVCAAVNGLLMVSGTAIGVITGVDIAMDLAGSTKQVVGQTFTPEIFLGRANVSGTFNALLEDATLLNNFADEDEVSALLYLTTSNADAADAVSIYLPRLKFGGADVQLSGEAEVPISIPFQCLKYVGSGNGIDQTTIRVCDTAA